MTIMTTTFKDGLLCDGAAFTAAGGYAFLAFNLLCAPCFAAMGAIRREMNNARWFFTAIGYQCGLAYAVSLCVYQIGSLIVDGVFGVGTAAAFLVVAGMAYLLFRLGGEGAVRNVNGKKLAGAR